MNAGGEQPPSMENTRVEFGIWKTHRDALRAYNVTLPGGGALKKATVEHRQNLVGQMYRGEVTLWNIRSGWGWIKADPSQPLPPDVQQKLTQQTQEAKARAEQRGKESSNDELLYVTRSDLAQGLLLD